MRTGAPPALGGSRTWEFAGSAAETEPLKKASKHFAGIKKYRGNYMHAPQLPSVVVPSKPEVMGSAGKERSKRMRKVTDVDILDAEEGGSEPQIDVEGRRETLSESDLAALQAKQEEPLTTGPEEFQGYETSSGGEGDVRSTDSQSTAKVDHQSDAHDSWTGRETEVDTGLSADDMPSKADAGERSSVESGDLSSAILSTLPSDPAPDSGEATAVGDDMVSQVTTDTSLPVGKPGAPIFDNETHVD